MPFELFVALRFLREGRSQTALILGGTTVGVAVIVFITALISGLQRTLVDQTLSSQAHVMLRRPERVARVLPPGPGEAIAAVVEKVPERERSVEQWRELLAVVRADEGVVAAAPTAAGAAFASRAEVSRAVSLRGVEEESFDAVLQLGRKMKAGAFRLNGAEVVIGSVLAGDLGLAVGDTLRLTTAEGRGDVFTVSGIFDLGNKDVNQRWVLVSLRAAQSLLDLSGGITTIEVKVRDVFTAEAIAGRLAGRTGLVAESWMKVNRQLLTALRSQSASAWMIQGFVVLLPLSIPLSIREAPPVAVADPLADHEQTIALGEKATTTERPLTHAEEKAAMYAGPPPEHTNMFFTIYFAMTGLHGIHVLFGVFVFIWLLIRAVKGHFTPDYFGPVDFAALYWHIVDLIWIFLFPLLYLIH